MCVCVKKYKNQFCLKISKKSGKLILARNVKETASENKISTRGFIKQTARENNFFTGDLLNTAAYGNNMELNSIIHSIHQSLLFTTIYASHILYIKIFHLCSNNYLV